MKEEALKLADELLRDNTQLTVESAYMICRLVEELDKQGEPVAVIYQHPDHLRPAIKFTKPFAYKAMTAVNPDIPLYTAPQTKPLSDHLSQPLPNTLYVDETGKTSVFDGKQWKPLYQTKSLTDDELQKMWKGNVESCGWDSVIDFARAIEERHGIK